MNTISAWILVVLSYQVSGGSAVTVSPHLHPTLAACEAVRAALPSARPLDTRCIYAPVLVPAQQQSLPPQQQQERPAKKAVQA